MFTKTSKREREDGEIQIVSMVLLLKNSLDGDEKDQEAQQESQFLKRL